MGNIEKAIENPMSEEELRSKLKNYDDPRSDSEIEITNRLAHLLSDLNTRRVLSRADMSAKKLNWSNYVFVCVQGFPALPNEFQTLNLPGQCLYFSGLLFGEIQSSLSEKEKESMVYRSVFKEEAKRLHHLLESIEKKRKIIFVYHSAGNFILSMYFYYYGFEWMGNRVKGMIDVSGGPMRYYLSAKMMLPVILPHKFEDFVGNADKIHALFVKTLKKVGFAAGFQHKYQTLAFLHYLQSPDYGQMFEATQNHPKVLKLIMYGRNDTLFESGLLNEKAIYFSYRVELEEQYLSKLRRKFNQMNSQQMKEGIKYENLQERFIFAIPKGQHSIHAQERNHALIRAAVQQYLSLIHDP